MPQADEELNTLATTIDAFVADCSVLDLVDRLARVEAAATEVGRAASGSWIGYHADVYYADLQPPPAGRHFDAEWGLRAVVGHPPIRDWVKRRPEEIEAEILLRADVSDLSAFREMANRGVAFLRDGQATVASILRISLAAHPDVHLDELLQKSQALNATTLDAYLKGRMPTQTSSRDSLAVSQGRRVPAHVMVLAKVAVARNPALKCEELAALARQTVAHLARVKNLGTVTAAASVAESLAGPNSAQARRRFRVSLSFAGERRKAVEAIAQFLATKISRDGILYDRWHEAEFSRANLDLLLQRLYRDESDLIAVFLSKEYREKEWCGLEWNAIRELTNARLDDRVMFLRFDDSAIPGIFAHTGHTWIGEGSAARPASEIAPLILQRVVSAAGSLPGPPSRDFSAVAPIAKRTSGRRFSAIGYGIGVAAALLLAFALFYKEERVTTSCLWLSPEGRRVLTCTFVNNTRSDLRDVRLRLPFLVGEVTLDGREGSPFLGPEAFVEKPQPPIWFKVDAIEPDRPRTARFVPSTAPNGDDPRGCLSGSYTIRIGSSPTPIPVELQGCP